MEHGETSSKEPYEINAETEECENVSIAAGDVETGLHSTRIGKWKLYTTDNNAAILIQFNVYFLFNDNEYILM